MTEINEMPAPLVRPVLVNDETPHEYQIATADNLQTWTSNGQWALVAIAPDTTNQYINGPPGPQQLMFVLRRAITDQAALIQESYENAAAVLREELAHYRKKERESEDRLRELERSAKDHDLLKEQNSKLARELIERQDQLKDERHSARSRAADLRRIEETLGPELYEKLALTADTADAELLREDVERVLAGKKKG